MKEFDFSKLLQTIQDGESRPDRDVKEVFPGYGEASASVQADDVYTVNENKVVDDYGGEAKTVQSVEQVSCPACGAAMTYDPDTGTLHCDYCGHNSEIVAGGATERVLKLGLDTAKKWREETRVFRCGNCGAETVFDRHEFATVCPFCGSSSVTQVEDLEGVRPNAVLPFSFGEEQARKHYAKWIKRRIFAPRAFKKKSRLALKGVYVPCWTFDSRTFSNYQGVVGDYYYVTVGSGKNRHTERRIRYRRVSGSWQRSFDDVAVPSGTQVETEFFDRLGTFGTDAASEYTDAYLAGFTAEHYNLPLDRGWDHAQNRMKDTVRAEIISSLRCDVVQSLDVRTGFADNTFKYVLLPVYVFRRDYKQKNYKLYVNGRTGCVTGRYPKSGVKISSAVFGVLALIAGIIALVVLL